MRPVPSAGGNWIYGGRNDEIVLQATQIQDSRNAGYNLAYGIAEMTLRLSSRLACHAIAGCRAQPATVMRCISRRSP